MRFASRKIFGFVVAGVVLAAAAVAVEPPAAPKVSTFAPAKDIASQVEFYVERLEESVASEEDFTDSEARLAKDSNTLILLAVAAGLDDQDNQYKAAAPAILKAAEDLTKAKGYAAAKAGVAEVKKALQSTAGSPAELKWGKLASLPELMKQVPLVNSRLKRNLRREKFEAKPTSKAKGKEKSIAGDAATLAVIAQGSIADTAEAKSDEDVTKWFGFCVQMRDAATALNKAVHARDKAAADKAVGALNQSCDDCHAVFHKEAPKADEEESDDE